MSDTLKEWFIIIRFGGFWGIWVGYFLVHIGIDKGWGDEHPTLWWILVIATFIFLLAFQPYLDFNLPGPNPTPCLFTTFVIGILIGRYAIPFKKQ